MTLLEESLPIEKLNPVALAEDNAKKPVYRMHKWWARRLGSVFRTILPAAFRPAEPGGNGAGSRKAGPGGSNSTGSGKAGPGGSNSTGSGKAGPGAPWPAA